MATPGVSHSVTRQRTVALRECIERHYHVEFLLSKTRAHGRKKLYFFGDQTLKFTDAELNAMEAKIKEEMIKLGIRYFETGFRTQKRKGVPHLVYYAHVPEVSGAAPPTPKPTKERLVLTASTSTAAVRTRWVEGCVPQQPH